MGPTRQKVKRGTGSPAGNRLSGRFGRFFRSVTCDLTLVMARRRILFDVLIVEEESTGGA